MKIINPGPIALIILMSVLTIEILNWQFGPMKTILAIVCGVLLVIAIECFYTAWKEITNYIKERRVKKPKPKEEGKQ